MAYDTKKTDTPRKRKMVYTPKHHIPVGEVVETEEGRKMLRIKKPGDKATEDVTIEYLVSAVINTDKP